MRPIVEELGASRVERDRSVVTHEGFIDALQCDQDISAAIVRIRMIGLESYRTIAARQRIVQTPKLQKHHSPAENCRGVGLEFDRSVIVGQCFIEPLESEQRIRQIDVSFCKLRPERDRFPVARHGVVEALQFLERVAPIVVGVGFIGIHLQREIELQNGVGREPTPHEKDSQKVEAFETPWINPEDLPAMSFGFRQSAGAEGLQPALLQRADIRRCN
jgi:hypothetical protein